MFSTVIFKNSKIRFSDCGEGTPVVLLHGYLESLEIFDEFSHFLSKKFRVICIDLPGHGKSGLIDDIHTMELMAEGVKTVMDHLKISAAFIIGHSMGGYASLALLEKYPQQFLGLCLFHSHPWPDSETTMKNRCREIVLVKQGKKELISRINIPNAFSKSNLESMKNRIEKAGQIAIATEDNGIIAALYGMMARTSRVKLLENCKVPVLLIGGIDDTYISYNKLSSELKLPAGSKFVTLRNSGHMGFIEEPEKSANAIISFISEIISSYSGQPTS